MHKTRFIGFYLPGGVAQIDGYQHFKSISLYTYSFQRRLAVRLKRMENSIYIISHTEEVTPSDKDVVNLSIRKSPNLLYLGKHAGLRWGPISS